MSDEGGSGLEVRRVPWVEDDLKRNGVTEETLGRFCWALRWVRWSNPSSTLEELFAVVRRDAGGVTFYEAQLSTGDKGTTVYLFFAVGVLGSAEAAILFGCAGASTMRGKAKKVTLELMAIRAAGVNRHFSKSCEQ